MNVVQRTNTKVWLTLYWDAGAFLYRNKSCTAGKKRRRRRRRQQQATTLWIIPNEYTTIFFLAVFLDTQWIAQSRSYAGMLCRVTRNETEIAHYIYMVVLLVYTAPPARWAWQRQRQQFNHLCAHSDSRYMVICSTTHSSLACTQQADSFLRVGTGSMLEWDGIWAHGRL